MAKTLTSKRFEVCVEGSHSVHLPEQVVLPFVSKGIKRVRVRAYHEGKTLDFHAALQQRKGVYIMTFGKRYQKELGLYPTDYFDIQIFEDDSKYGVEMPEELQAVLNSDLEALKVFENFTDGKKRSIIYYILRFKNSQTRINKALIISENIKRGIIDSSNITKSHL